MQVVTQATHAIDVSDAQNLVVEGAKLMGLTLKTEQAEKLYQYLLLIGRWNKVYNLTAIASEVEMARWHILDALTVLTRLNIENKVVLDVGSGAGLPGVVLAIMEPSSQIYCVDAVQKKTSFIQNTASQLGLKNLRAVHGRIEKIRPIPSDIVISRAFASLSDFTNLTMQHLKMDGFWLAMKGLRPLLEEGALRDGVELFHVEQVILPEPIFEAGVQRHFLYIRKQRSGSDILEVG